MYLYLFTDLKLVCGTMKIDNAELATEKAVSFIRKEYPMRGFLARPIRAIRQEDVWTVELDIGIVRAVLATIKIRAHTGEIIEYTIPPMGAVAEKEG